MPSPTEVCDRKQMADLIRSELKLMRDTSAAAAEQRARIQREISALSFAGLDEMHAKKHYRPNIHE